MKKIKNIGKPDRKISPKKVAKALGAEEYSFTKFLNYLTKIFRKPKGGQNDS